MCVHIMLSSVWVAEWPSLGKELLTRLTICSLCILSICNFSYFPFWFFRAGFGSDGFSSWYLHTFYFYLSLHRFADAEADAVCGLHVHKILAFILTSLL